jgi:hypothetical protein
MLRSFTAEASRVHTPASCYLYRDVTFIRFRVAELPFLP